MYFDRHGLLVSCLKEQRHAAIRTRGLIPPQSTPTETILHLLPYVALFSLVRASLPDETPAQPSSNELPKLLLNHSDFIAQVTKLNGFINYFGLPNFILRGTQEITFDQVQVSFQGSGLRSIFAILAALTDDAIKLLLIDEPELSLEARLQKLLRDLLYEASKEKQIIITTHSHLFLNRAAITSNYLVKKENGEVSISRVSSEAELYEITFQMLGSSVEDLFFPRNFLIVEGATDQIIVNRVMELKGIDKTKIKVVSASGIDKIHHVLSAIYTALLPLVLTGSPYRDRVVALIDQVTDKTSPTYTKIQGNLPNRLFELDAPSIPRNQTGWWGIYGDIWVTVVLWAWLSQ